MGVAGSSGRSSGAKGRSRSAASLAASSRLKAKKPAKKTNRQAAAPALKLSVTVNGKNGRNGKRVSTAIVVNKPLKFTIASDYAAGRDVQKRILDDVTRLGFNPQSHFAIKLALEEALINAIKHGNRLDPRKKVHIEARVSPEQFEITIEDEGPGFKRGSVPDPTLEENIEKCSGRGILLMEAYMNSVQWSHGGRRVKLVKKNEDDMLPRR